MNLTAPCNAACNCELVKYSPVCHETTGTTFFSACHAGCRSLVNDTTFGDCACLSDITSVFHERKLEGASLRLDDESFNRFPSLPNDRVTAGPCKQNCFKPFVWFFLVSTVTNILGCSGRIGNVLLNYRCVDIKDKSMAQGIALLMVSLFALIPGPIIFGAIMDSTCMIWDMSCQNKGNCWFYHRDNFRYYVNLTAAS